MKYVVISIVLLASICGLGGCTKSTQASPAVVASTPIKATAPPKPGSIPAEADWLADYDALMKVNAQLQDAQKAFSAQQQPKVDLANGTYARLYQEMNQRHPNYLFDVDSRTFVPKPPDPPKDAKTPTGTSAK